jgi:putative ABC transporter, ATP-binding protein
MIKKLSEEQGMTVLISSHILSELYQVSTRFGIIDHGHIIREITKDEFEHLSEDYIVLKTNQLALASRILQDQLHQHFKVVNSDNEIHIFDKSHVIKAIVKELVKQEVDIDEIYYKRQDLENYFTQLVDSERR